MDNAQTINTPTNISSSSTSLSSKKNQVGDVQNMDLEIPIDNKPLISNIFVLLGSLREYEVWLNALFNGAYLGPILSLLWENKVNASTERPAAFSERSLQLIWKETICLPESETPLDTHWWNVGLPSNTKYTPYKFDKHDFERMHTLTERLETIQKHCKNILPIIGKSATNLMRHWALSDTLQDTIFSNMTLAYAQRSSKKSTVNSPNEIKHVRALTTAVLKATGDYTVFDALSSETNFFREAVCIQGAEQKTKKHLEQMEWFKTCQTIMKDVRKHLQETNTKVPSVDKDEYGNVYTLEKSISDYLQLPTTTTPNIDTPSPIFVRLQALHGCRVFTEDLQRLIISITTNEPQSDNVHEQEDNKRYLSRVITGLCLLLSPEFIITRAHACLPPGNTPYLSNIRKYIPPDLNEEDMEIIETEVIRIQKDAWQQGTYLWLSQFIGYARILTKEHGWSAIADSIPKQAFSAMGRVLPPINPLWNSTFKRYQELYTYKLQQLSDTVLDMKESAALARKVMYQVAEEFNVPWDADGIHTHPELDTDFDEETEQQKRMKRKAKQVIANNNNNQLRSPTRTTTSTDKVNSDKKVTDTTKTPPSKEAPPEEMDDADSDDSGWGEGYLISEQIIQDNISGSAKKSGQKRGTPDNIPSPVPLVVENGDVKVMSDRKNSTIKRSKHNEELTQVVNEEIISKKELFPRVGKNAIPPPISQTAMTTTSTTTTTTATTTKSSQGSSTLQNTDPVMVAIYNRLQRAREERLKQQNYENQLIGQTPVEAPSVTTTGIISSTTQPSISSQSVTNKSPRSLVTRSVPRETDENDDDHRVKQVNDNLLSAADRIRRLASNEPTTIENNNNSSSSSSQGHQLVSTTTQSGIPVTAMYPRINTLNMSGSVAYGVQNIANGGNRSGPFNPNLQGRRIPEEEIFHTDATNLQSTTRQPPTAMYQEPFLMLESGSRKRNKWTPEEENALRQGMAKYNNETGFWADIREEFFKPLFEQGFPQRTSTDLKDKWRVLTGRRSGRSDILHGAYGGH